MASHLLDEVEKVCTHVAILKTGNLITTGKVADVLMDEDLVELSAQNLQQLAEILNGMSNKITIDEKNGVVQMTLPKGTSRLDEINRFCFNKGVVLNHMLLKKKRLEARFFELTNN